MVTRKTSAIPEIPPGYKGSQRVFAAILYTALKRTRYDVSFLYGKRHQGLCIALSGSTFIVANADDPAAFTLKDAEECARHLNAEFGKAVPATHNLATARTGRTEIGSVRYAEVAMQCPNLLKLQLLRRALLR